MRKVFVQYMPYQEFCVWNFSLT